MKFDGWCNISGDIWKTHVEKDFYKWGKNVTPFRLPLETEYHTSWQWIHSVWEKFRELRHKPTKVRIRGHYDKCESIISAISYGTPLEAFTALYEAINWFNELNIEQ